MAEVIVKNIFKENHYHVIKFDYFGNEMTSKLTDKALNYVHGRSSGQILSKGSKINVIRSLKEKGGKIVTLFKVTKILSNGK